MKRVLNVLWIFAVVFILFVGISYAQMFNDPVLLKKVGLRQNQIKKIMKIMEQTAKIKREAQIELNLRKAQLEKLLFPVNVDMNAVEKILKESLEWKYKAELAEIKARVEIRKIMGEEKWYNYLLELRNRRKMGKFRKPMSGKSMYMRPSIEKPSLNNPGDTPKSPTSIKDTIMLQNNGGLYHRLEPNNMDNLM